MEYLQGGDLLHYIGSKGRLSESQSALFFKQIVEAICYYQSKGVTHRDLKPENILLSCEAKKDDLQSEITLKIVDFGLSNLNETFEDLLLKTPCGSPCYAAPEVIYVI